MAYRQAYLIMVHKVDSQLILLLKMLNSCENDLYVHIDKKTKISNLQDFDFSFIDKSRLFFIDRVNVQWGGYSLINAEINLLKSATKNHNYKYYHLISGNCVPLKENKIIMEFFKSHEGTEFLTFDSTEGYEYRYQYYHIFQELAGRKKNFYWSLSKINLFIQKFLKIHRNRNLEVGKGSNWFSITDDLARYILQNEDWIHKTFKYTIACDEVFLQTIVKKSEFMKRVYSFENKQINNNDNMRYIDWNRGNPYVFQKDDIPELLSSEMMFARKVGLDVATEIYNILRNK